MNDARSDFVGCRREGGCEVAAGILLVHSHSASHHPELSHDDQAAARRLLLKFSRFTGMALRRGGDRRSDGVGLVLEGRTARR